VLARHGPVDVAAVERAVRDAVALSASVDAVLKHEPAIMHVRCVDLAWVRTNTERRGLWGELNTRSPGAFNAK
jgi:hypothetical protein